MQENMFYPRESEGKIYPPSQQSPSERVYIPETPSTPPQPHYQQQRDVPPMTYQSPHYHQQQRRDVPPQPHYQQQRDVPPQSYQPSFQSYIPMYAVPVVPYPVATPPDKYRELAVAGFVLGLVSLVGGLLPCGLGFLVSCTGIILSAIGMQSTQRKGLAIAGLLLSILGILCSGMFFFLNFFFRFLLF